VKYSDGFRGSIIKKVLAGKTAYQISRETGINAATVQSWCQKHEAGTLVLDGSEGELKAIKP
jgi:transposase-like protein